MSLALWSPEVSKAPQRFRSSKTQLKEAWRNRCLVHLQFMVELLNLVACPPPPSSPALRPLVYYYLLCHFPDSSVSRIVHPQESRQPPSLGIRLLPSDSDRFGYPTKGEPPSPLCICPPTQRLLYCLPSFSTRSFSSTSVRNSLSESCIQHCFKCSAKRWLEVSWFSLLESFDEAPLLSVNMCSENTLVARIHSEECNNSATISATEVLSALEQ